MHFTFLRWQASQALFAVVGAGDVVVVDDSGMFPVCLRPLEETDTSTGPFNVEINIRSD